MDFDVSDREQDLLDRTRAILAARAPETPSREQVFDADLWARLQSEGVLDLARPSGAGVLDAVLIAEHLSAANALVPAAVAALVGPLVFAEAVTQPIAVIRVGSAAPIRFAADCPFVVVVDRAQARLHRIVAGSATPVRSNYIYPMARCGTPDGAALAIAPANAVMRRWQLALGAEMVGAMQGALDHLVGYLKSREQFGRKLASFQALQHRLAEHAVSLETSRWLVRNAAWHDQDDLAAAAAAHAAAAARRLCVDAHQLAGARGYVIAFGLHLWTLRLQALSVEAGGMHGHALVAADRRWGASGRMAAPIAMPPQKAVA